MPLGYSTLARAGRPFSPSITAAIFSSDVHFLPLLTVLSPDFEALSIADFYYLVLSDYNRGRNVFNRNLI